LATGYIRGWRPLLEVLQHIQCVFGVALGDAWGSQLKPALYDGKVKSRRAGVRYQTFRHDGIKPESWYRAVVLISPSRAEVIFNYDGRQLENDPLHPSYLPREVVEIFWADVLKFWPEPSLPSPEPGSPSKVQTKRPKWSPEQLDTWMRENVHRGVKRDDAIADCCTATGATVRGAAAAWKRLPGEVKLKRGQRASLRKNEQ
jgi:hypothetical protein